MNAVQIIAMNQQHQHGVPVVDVEDFEPQPRDRCNTWPLQKPAGDLSHNTSPLIHEVLPEEDDDALDEDEGLDDDDSSLEATSDASAPTDTSGLHAPYHNNQSFPQAAHANHQNCALSGVSNNNNNNCKKNSSRRNAWGNLSYADLITQAILSSPDKRLTLSQIYDWMVHNVPYFRDKGDSNSSAGWKNSIRHNLSLHSRFMRVQNEGAGKSSWWMINPDAKHGKCSRRRTGSMEQSSKLWEKKRGRLKKSVGGCHGDEQEYHSAAVSMETLPLDDLSDSDSRAAPPTPAAFADFRCRLGSSFSRQGSDPQLLSEENWLANEDIQQNINDSQVQAESHSPYTALVETLPQSMKLETTVGSNSCDLQAQQHSPYRNANGHVTPMYNNGQQQQQQPLRIIKSEPMLDNNGPLLGDVLERLYYSPANQRAPQLPPNNRNVVGGGVSLHHHGNGVGGVEYRNSLMMMVPADHNATRRLNYYYYGPPSNGTNMMVNNCEQLPSELSELHYDSYFKSDVQWDIDQVIRHELTLTGKLDFNDLANI